MVVVEDLAYYAYDGTLNIVAREDFYILFDQEREVVVLSPEHQMKGKLDSLTKIPSLFRI